MARAVAAAIKKLDDVNVVITWRNSTDDESGTFAPALARQLRVTRSSLQTAHALLSLHRALPNAADGDDEAYTPRALDCAASE